MLLRPPSLRVLLAPIRLRQLLLPGVAVRHFSNRSDATTALPLRSDDHYQHHLGTEQLQLTLAIIKPHICKDPYSLQEIRQTILNDNFYFIRSIQRELTRREAEEFYLEHQGKFFYNRLVTFMTSGEISVHLLARHNAIRRWRELMGPTKVFRTRLDAPTTIRGRFGVSDTRNATHGSDSVESVTKEVGFFFHEFVPKQWFSVEEPIYRRQQELMQSMDSDRRNEKEEELLVDDDGRKVKISFDARTWQHEIVPRR